MTLQEISNIRIINQNIAKPSVKTVKDLVGWMGAMQAQDFAMTKWAIGLRLQGATEKTFEAAYNSGEIIRTHLMRPTWHLVSADDIYWMLQLTARKIKSSLRSRHKQLELTNVVIARSNLILEKALADGTALTRDAIAELYNNANISTDNNRLSHLLFRAELDEIICSGPLKNGKLTYTLLPERIPDKKILTRDESLAELAKRYFTSHGPATLADFSWWSGLSVTEARHALEQVKAGFISETLGTEIYWFTPSSLNGNWPGSQAYLLPAFDEFLISYTDRSASLKFADNKKAVSNNGIFHPVVVVNGQVTGLWKRTVKKEVVLVEIELFRPDADEETMKLIAKAAGSFVDFLGKKAEIKMKYLSNGNLPSL